MIKTDAEFGIMRYETQSIADRLRETRETRQLSQRELSRLSGVPQPQISRIEANNVDLRLSSLVALASALDLELALVPRQALPAVKSISRQTEARNVVQPPPVGKELQRLQKAISTIQSDAPTAPELEEIRKGFASIQRVPIDPRFLPNLRTIRNAIEYVKATAQWESLSEATEIIRRLRNQIASHDPTSEQRSPSRSAYSLDEDGEDA